MSVFRSIFDHVPIEHIDYEINGYVNIKDGIQIKTKSSNNSVSNLSKELAWVIHMLSSTISVLKVTQVMIISFYLLNNSLTKVNSSHMLPI